ncbi:MAG: efflux RND transporter periplasmic adaptor subunit [Sporichthyaceae bacterium]
MRLSASALCLGVLVASIAGCSADDSGIRLGTVGRSTVTEVVEAPATVTAKATAEVTSAADGRISELRVREGQTVRSGKVLLRMSSPRAERQLRDARRADAEAASAGNVSLQGGGLTSAQRRADANAQAAFVAARRSAKQIADPQVRAQALAAQRASEAQYAAARAQAQDAVRQFNAGLGSLSNAIGSLASAQRVQTRAAVAAAQRTVAALTVRSPIAGRVSLTTGGQPSGSTGSGTSLLDQLPDSLRGQAGDLLGSSGGAQVTGSLTEGQPVRSGQLLLRVTDDSTLTLAAQVDETDVLLVKPGVVARAELDAVPNAAYDANVTSIDPTPSTSTRGGVAYTVRLSLGRGTEDDGTTAPEPRPGMSAVVNLKVRTATDAIAVPAAAVFRDGRRDAVWVVRANIARKRLVRLGAQGQDTIQIVEGLKGGERIVVRGADRVRDGQRPQ